MNDQKSAVTRSNSGGVAAGRPSKPGNETA